MGMNNRQRRAAKKRKRDSAQRPSAARPSTRTAPAWTTSFDFEPNPQAVQAEIIALAERAMTLLDLSTTVAEAEIRELQSLSSRANQPEVDPALLVGQEVLASLERTWNYGWQPADIVHLVRRKGSGAMADWIALAITHEARRSHAADRAPMDWLDQLSGLGVADAGSATELIATAGRATAAQWIAALSVLTLLRRLPIVETLIPPPSRWDRATRAPRQRATTQAPGDSSLVARIRALLAKAESTEFAAEAEVFTAKAQDLMTRHAIDEALVREQAGTDIAVHGRRILVDSPYALDKAALLNQVAAANRVQAVWNDFAASMTVVGVRTDVEQVEMLFTSLLIQATRAMTEAGRAPSASRVNRSSSFRRAFLTGYAVRIGQRLTKASEQAVASYGGELVPVLARQRQAIEDEVERLFPHIIHKGSSRTFDRRGWEAGTEAADRAVFTTGQVGR